MLKFLKVIFLLTLAKGICSLKSPTKSSLQPNIIMAFFLKKSLKASVCPLYLSLASSQAFLCIGRVSKAWACFS